MDNFTSLDEVGKLKEIALSAMNFGGGSGGTTIFALTGGALSKGDKFIDLYKIIRSDKIPVFRKTDIQLLSNLTDKIEKLLKTQFDIKSLYLASPMFFSRMTDAEPKTEHDEYWHSHIDKIAYGSFTYTCLIYLADYKQDFTGGQFVFDDNDNSQTIYPAQGKLLCFTSGAENPHHVTRVKGGTRMAITIAFTCDKESKSPSLSTITEGLLFQEDIEQ